MDDSENFSQSLLTICNLNNFPDIGGIINF